jgi:hypothetical protein
MQYVIFTLGPMLVPMIETDDGQHLTTIPIAAKAVGMTPTAVSTNLSAHKDRFSHLSVSDADAKELIEEHRGVFEVTRIRKDARLLNADDMVELSMLSNNYEFRLNFRKFLREYAQLHYVRREDFDRVSAARDIAEAAAITLEARLATVDIRLAALERILPTADNMASAGGSALANYKKIKRAFEDN